MMISLTKWQYCNVYLEPYPSADSNPRSTVQFVDPPCKRACKCLVAKRVTWWSAQRQTEGSHALGSIKTRTHRCSACLRVTTSSYQPVLVPASPALLPTGKCAMIFRHVAISISSVVLPHLRHIVGCSLPGQANATNFTAFAIRLTHRVPRLPKEELTHLTKTNEGPVKLNSQILLSSHISIICPVHNPLRIPHIDALHLTASLPTRPLCFSLRYKTNVGRTASSIAPWWITHFWNCLGWQFGLAS